MPYRLYIQTPASIKYIDDLFETKHAAIETANRIAEEFNTDATIKLIALVRLSMADEPTVKLFHSDTYKLFLEKS
jgi:hypothetical protein